MKATQTIKPNKTKVTLPYSLPENGDLNEVFAVFDANVTKAGIIAIECELKLNDKNTVITAKLKTIVDISEVTLTQILRKSLGIVATT